VAEYRVVFARSARRELEALEAGVARRIIARVEALTTDPRPRGCVKLQGASDLWRIRIGDYRVVYAIDDKHISSTSESCDTEVMRTGRSGSMPNSTFDWNRWLAFARRGRSTRALTKW
jgi:mRNA interferase RelE/StbE